MNREEYNNIQTKICSRGGDSERLISKGFISNINRIRLWSN